MPSTDLLLFELEGGTRELVCHNPNDDRCDTKTDRSSAHKPPAKTDLSNTTATDSLTLASTCASRSITSQSSEESSPIVLSQSPSVSTKTEELDHPSPTMHRAFTLGGTNQLILLDPHLIALDRLGPSSLEAQCIEIATRPSTQNHYTTSNASNNSIAMVPRIIRVRHSLKPILRRHTDDCYSPGYKAPAPIKQVRFSLNKTNDNLPGNCIDSLTNHEVLALWWTRDELKDMETREWFAARNFVRSTPRFAEAFERVLIECFKYIEKDPKLSNAQLQPHGGLGLTNDEALEMMTSHDFRGLERSMVHWLSVGAAKHYFQIRKKCSAALIKAQSRWRNVDESNEVKQQKIAAGIRNYSLFSEKLAQLLAQGDATIVYRGHPNACCPIVRSEMLRPSHPRGRVVL